MGSVTPHVDAVSVGGGRHGECDTSCGCSGVVSGVGVFETWGV